MKLKELKKILNKLTKEQLDNPLFIQLDNISVSRQAVKVRKQRWPLYYDGSDDPAPLYSLSQLVNEGYDKEEIAMCTIEIPRGAIVIEC